AGPARDARIGPRAWPGSRAGPRPDPAGSFPCAALAQPVQGFGEDSGALFVGAALLHVREMRLVRVGPFRLRGVLRVTPGRQPAARALPLVGNFRADGEVRPRFVLVQTPVRDRHARNRLATLGLSAWAATTDSGSPNSATATHHRCSHPYLRAD